MCTTYIAPSTAPHNTHGNPSFSVFLCLSSAAVLSDARRSIKTCAAPDVNTLVKLLLERRKKQKYMCTYIYRLEHRTLVVSKRPRDLQSEHSTLVFEPHTQGLVHSSRLGELPEAAGFSLEVAPWSALMSITVPGRTVRWIPVVLDVFLLPLN